MSPFAFRRLTEKLAVMQNREMFFEINPYVNGVQVMLVGKPQGGYDHVYLQIVSCDI